VRAEERKEIPSGDDLDSNGQLPREFIKLGEDDMSEMAKYCREAGLEHMLFVCLKIFDKKISDNEAKETDAMANHPNAIHTRRFSHGTSRSHERSKAVPKVASKYIQIRGMFVLRQALSRDNGIRSSPDNSHRIMRG
jgi:hypothetical protein